MEAIQHQGKINSKSGFTLVEMMITVVIFTIGLVAILASVTSMARQQQFADLESITTNHMNFLLDDLQTHVTLGGVANITDYESRVYGDVSFFDAPVDGQVPGLAPESQVSMRLTGVVVADAAEVEVRMVVLGPSGRRLPYTTSRMITHEDENL